MTLPDPALQRLYLDLAWALVLVAVLLGAIVGPGASLVRRRRALAWVAGLGAVLALLPAPWSLSFWLGMAFQYPSVTTVVLCAVYALRFAGAPGPIPAHGLVPPLAAAMLASVAALLYASAFGWIPYDLYAFGYGRLAAALVGSAFVAAWVAVVPNGGWVCLAVAAAALVHMTFALPTGNAWDALLDPLLVLWAVSKSVRWSLPAWRRRSYGGGG